VDSGRRLGLANREQISGSRAEVSRPIGEFINPDNYPELRVTAEWTAGDESFSVGSTSLLRRAIGSVIR
jgi:hypothetical protein